MCNKNANFLYVVRLYSLFYFSSYLILKCVLLFTYQKKMFHTYFSQRHSEMRKIQRKYNTFSWAFLCCNSCSNFSLRSWRLVDSRWALRYRFSKVAIRSSWSFFCAAFSRKSLCSLTFVSWVFSRSFCVLDNVSSNSVIRPLNSATRRCHVVNSEL